MDVVGKPITVAEMAEMIDRIQKEKAKGRDINEILAEEAAKNLMEGSNESNSSQYQG